MKCLQFFLVFGFVAITPAALAQNAPPAPVAEQKGDPRADLKDLIGKITGRIKDGGKDAKALSGEIKQFDVLLQKYRAQKTDDVAEILFARAMLHLQVFGDYASAIADVRLLQKNFPDSNRGKHADEIVESIGNFQDDSARVERVRAAIEDADPSLKVGRPFPNFKAVDIDGKAISVEQFKGKVVLVDFWATWCGPCVGEIPNVKRAYAKFHDQGFEVIAISLDRNVKELKGFIQKHDLKWRQVFDRDNEGGGLAEQFNVRAIPTTFLIDRHGNLAASNLRGHALEIAVGGALKEGE